MISYFTQTRPLVFLCFLIPLSLCQAVGDHALLVFARNCPNIDQLNLGSCSRLTDHTCHSLARHCSKLRQVDISSCNNMTDNSLRALGRGCPLVSGWSSVLGRGVTRTNIALDYTTVLVIGGEE